MSYKNYRRFYAGTLENIRDEGIYKDERVTAGRCGVRVLSGKHAAAFNDMIDTCKAGAKIALLGILPRRGPAKQYFTRNTKKIGCREGEGWTFRKNGIISGRPVP